MAKNIGLVALLIALITSSCSEQKTPPNRTLRETQKALLLTWHYNSSEDFWMSYEEEVNGFLKELYEGGKLRYMLPFDHKPLSHPDKEGEWTGCLLVGLANDVQTSHITEEVTDYILKSSIKNNLVAADILHLQKGLDMFYPVVDGLANETKMDQILEYVFSEPTARRKYYDEQYIFSGPAMQELHRQDKAGRFIGFEVAQRIYGQSFPAWDLLHVVGFTPEQTEKATPIFMSLWNKHAERAFGEGMTFQKKKKEWDKIRQNIKSPASQNMTLTLPLKQ